MLGEGPQLEFLSISLGGSTCGKYAWAGRVTSWMSVGLLAARTRRGGEPGSSGSRPRKVLSSSGPCLCLWCGLVLSFRVLGVLCKLVVSKAGGSESCGASMPNLRGSGGITMVCCQTKLTLTG